MAFNAEMNVDGSGKPFRVLNFNFTLHQNIDQYGKPASGVHGGTVFVQFESTDDSSIAKWMVNPSKKTGGNITIFKSSDESTLKEIKFEDAYCVQFSESFNTHGSDAMTTSMTISAKKIDIGGIPHDNKWA